jgi:drug/metabolite transporter (DMT)-like permease
MATDLGSPPGLGITALLGDIIHDAQELMRQQLALFRQEIRDDLRKTRDGAIALAAGVGVIAMGGLLILLMLPLLLNWLVPSIPLWGCFGIIGAAAAAIGAALLYFAIERFKTIRPLSDNAALALKENLQWTTHPR